ncbi:MAG: hypothetical protein GF334_07880 [Candidatus Altiarchaeales archaeon]|nr:hypothetical protein [Candidatus Altiarchaeales archaeon]
MVTCDVCKNEIKHDGFGTGYGIGKDNTKMCYTCCAEEDKRFMEENNKITLYHSTNDNEEVINWPGTLRFRSVSFQGEHNWGLPRYDVYFIDHTGQKWYGRRIGDNTDLVHCRKVNHINWFAQRALDRIHNKISWS